MLIRKIQENLNVIKLIELIIQINEACDASWYKEENAICFKHD